MVKAECWRRKSLPIILLFFLLATGGEKGYDIIAKVVLLAEGCEEDYPWVKVNCRGEEVMTLAGKNVESDIAMMSRLGANMTGQGSILYGVLAPILASHIVIFTSCS